ncbi:MAG: tol-pal system protein YbgF, partial [Thermoanaerobaculia bacterium]
RRLRSSAMKHRALALPGLLAAALAAAGCVTTRDIEELGARIGEVQTQLLALQRQSPSKQEVADLEAEVGGQMGNLLKSEADMQVKLAELGSQIEQLQAKLEDTNYRLAQLSQQIAATNQELKSFRSAPPPAEGGDGGSAPPPPTGGGDPRALYNAAYNDYLKGNYDLAARGFQEYLAQFPATDLADNATYWIGEVYYRQGRYRQAIDQYDEVMARYPRSDKVASALLKKGYAHLELGERSQGVSRLREVVRVYPASDEANLARQRLRELDAG